MWTVLAVAAAGFGLVAAEGSAFPASHTELNRADLDAYRQQFRGLDKDADGAISAAELAGLAPDATAAAEGRAAGGTTPPPAADPAQLWSERGAGRQTFFKRDLAFVHVPMNLGQQVERAAIEGNREEETPMVAYGSFNAKALEDQWEQIVTAAGTGAQIWGAHFPNLREVSNYSGCNLAMEPPKHWPERVARLYFGKKRAFGLLRDPYDRLVSEFRYQASGGAKQPGDWKRSEVSEREGSMEREGPEYEAMFSACDVNKWLKAELRHYEGGDVFRGNCHLLPQSEYFEHPHGVTLPIDTRTMPESFNLEMERHGYTVRLRSESIRHDWGCARVSVFDLDEEAKRMVRKVYAADFELLCRHFGYCDDRELTCLSQVPFMCGAASSETA